MEDVSIRRRVSHLDCILGYKSVKDDRIINASLYTIDINKLYVLRGNVSVLHLVVYLNTQIMNGSLFESNTAKKKTIITFKFKGKRNQHTERGGARERESMGQNMLHFTRQNGRF